MRELYPTLFEGKACERLTDAHVKQVLNYLAVSKLKLGLLVNFGEDSLAWKRVVLEKRSGTLLIYINNSR
jgi:hypothetical protein